MPKLVAVCVGGALGSGARYLVATWAAGALSPALPLGTLLVNVVGSYLIAVIFGVSARSIAISPGVRLFLTTGVMGGFTTYSAFNYEVLRLIEDGALARALLYAGLTVVACLAAGVLGLASARLTGGAGAARSE